MVDNMYKNPDEHLDELNARKKHIEEETKKLNEEIEKWEAIKSNASERDADYKALTAGIEAFNKKHGTNYALTEFSFDFGKLLNW